MLKNLFKIDIWSKDIKIDNSSLITLLNKIQETHPSVVKSNISGYQSNNIDLSQPELQPLLTILDKEVLEYTKTLSLKGHLTCRSIWGNINEYKDTNKFHLHPGASISGVYYIDVPKDGGNIEFMNPAKNVLSYDWNEVEELNSYNGLYYYMPSITGRLYLFPSWLEHAVLPNMSHSKRYSLSFNYTTSNS